MLDVNDLQQLKQLCKWGQDIVLEMAVRLFPNSVPASEKARLYSLEAKLDALIKAEAEKPKEVLDGKLS